MTIGIASQSGPEVPYTANHTTNGKSMAAQESDPSMSLYGEGLSSSRCLSLSSPARFAARSSAV